MKDQQLYEYAIIRLVPRVEREEFLNIGVVLFAKGQKFLQVKYHLDEKRIQAFTPGLDIKLVTDCLASFERICNGTDDAGPIGALPIAQRFRWLTATRSTVVQMSKVHSGFSADPAATLEELYNKLVLI